MKLHGTYVAVKLTYTMGTKERAQLTVFCHRPQRQLLVELFHENPQDDTLDDGGDPKANNEELEVLLDYQHYYLPELEDRGVIDYDQENNIITKGPNFEELEPLLELIDNHQDELPKDWV